MTVENDFVKMNFKYLNSNFVHHEKLNAISGLIINSDYTEAIPYIDNLLFYNEKDLYSVDKSLEKLRDRVSRLNKEKSAYEEFLENPTRKPNYDINTCLKPFNAAIKALYPFFKLLKNKLQPGEAILALEDSYSWLATILTGIFPDNPVVIIRQRNEVETDKNDSYEGFHFWFQKEQNISVIFCDLNKPLPFSDQSFSLIIGYDDLQNFNQPLLTQELLRIAKEESAIFFPHVHLANSEPDLSFEDGEKQVHQFDYQSFFQRVSESSNRHGYIFSELKLFMFNQSSAEKIMKLISEPETKDYYSLIAFLPNSWYSENLEAFNFNYLQSVENSRILINPLLDINLNQQLIKVNERLSDSSANIYPERIENTDGFLLDDISCKLLYWGEYCLTLAEIAVKLGCDINIIVDICKKLESKDIIHVLPISEKGLRRQNFIGTGKYRIPYSEQNFRTLWLKAVDRYQENILIYGEDGSELSYGDCNIIISNIIRSLETSGLKKGDKIIFYCRANTEEILTIWACLQTGIIAVPIDHHTSKSFIRDIISQIEIKCSFVSNRTYNTAKHIFPNIPIIVFDEEKKIPLEENDLYFSNWCVQGTSEIQNSISDTDEAVFLYFAGPTGRAVGVTLFQGNLFRTGRLSCKISQWEKSDKYFVLACMKTINGFRNCCFTPLMVGASIVLPSEDAFQNTIISIPEAIFNSKSTILLINPSLIKGLIILKNRNAGQPGSIRVVMSSEDIGFQYKHYFFDAFNINIDNYYRLTETIGFFIIQTDKKAGENHGLIGRPYGGIAQLVDKEDKIVPVGQTGELRIYSENILKEYHEGSELANEFIRNGWLYTGDLAKFTEEGNLIVKSA